MKTYVDIDMKGNEEGTTKCLAVKDCKLCHGSGISGWRMTRYAPKSILHRNKPCHCESGLKYKKCCGARPREMDGEPQRCICVIETELNVNFVKI